MQIKVVTYIINETTNEYRAFNNETNEQLFKNTIHECHIAMSEYIACVHALMYLKKNNISGSVLTKSEYIKKSIETKTYKHQSKNKQTNMLLGRCRYWLHEQKHEMKIEIIK